MRIPIRTLADDTSAELVPRVLDQLPAQAWDFGPVFVLAIVVVLGVMGIGWYAIRRFDRHMTDVLNMLRGHLKDNEATNHQMQLTLAAMEIRLQTNICRWPNGPVR